MLGTGRHLLEIDVNGVSRSAEVYIPASLAGRKRAPLVMMFHGAGATARWALHETRWPDTADREGFLAVFPQGLPPHPDRPPTFLGNPPSWDDGSMWSQDHRRDDTAFIRQLLDRLIWEEGADAEHLFATGFSNGAGMVFRLAVELPGRFAAIAPVSGYCWLDQPHLTKPLRTLYIVGDSDPLVPLEGGEVRTFWKDRVEYRPPVRETLEKWAQAGGVLTVRIIEGHGHHWPGGAGLLTLKLAGPRSEAVSANDLIWGFFRES